MNRADKTGKKQPPKRKRVVRNAAEKLSKRSDADQALVDEYTAYLKMRRNPTKMKYDRSDDGNSTVDWDDNLLGSAEIWKALAASGNLDMQAAVQLYGQSTTASRPGSVQTPETITGDRLLVENIAPLDAIEAMLATQMVATHNTAMSLMGRAHNASLMPQFDSYSNQSNKFLRTFAAQVEALKRHRQKASQTIRVERVYVNEGGQAIVGDVHHTGGGAQTKSEEQAHALGYAPGTPLWSEDPEGYALPVSGNEKRTVQNARRTIDGRAKGK